MSLQSVQRAMTCMRQGGMVIMIDDENRENEGDLCIAAECCDADAINFMATHARGLICLALTDQRLNRLDLPMMVDNNTSKHETAFTVSIEARQGVTTGISAADRAETIRVAVAPNTEPSDLVRPGHVFPLRARHGGVLVRSGHTEGVVDLARLAGFTPAGVICEVMNDNGSMARLDDLEVFAKKHDLPIVSIASLIEYRAAHESLVQRLAVREIEHPKWGTVTLYAYGTCLDQRQHLAVVKGRACIDGPPLVRVHSGYPLSNIFGDLLSDDRAKLNAALDRLGQERSAVLLCLDQGDAPVPLSTRIEQMGTPLEATPWQPRPQRVIGIGAQILRDLDLEHIRILTNHPRQIKGLKGYGLHVDEVVALDTEQKPRSVPKLEVL